MIWFAVAASPRPGDEDGVMAVLNAPIVLGPNQPAHFYRGGAGIARFRGTPQPSERSPEDWVGSTTEIFSRPGAGLTRLDSGETLRDAIAAAPAGFLGPDHVARYGADPGLLVKILDTDQRPSPRQRRRRLPADAAGRAGDDSDSPGQVARFRLVCHGSPSAACHRAVPRPPVRSPAFSAPVMVSPTTPRPSLREVRWNAATPSTARPTTRTTSPLAGAPRSPASRTSASRLTLVECVVALPKSRRFSSRHDVLDARGLSSQETRQTRASRSPAGYCDRASAKTARGIIDLTPG